MGFFSNIISESRRSPVQRSTNQPLVAQTQTIRSTSSMEQLNLKQSDSIQNATASINYKASARRESGKLHTSNDDFSSNTLGNNTIHTVLRHDSEYVRTESSNKGKQFATDRVTDSIDSNHTDKANTNSITPNKLNTPALSNDANGGNVVDSLSDSVSSNDYLKKSLKQKSSETKTATTKNVSLMQAMTDSKNTCQVNGVRVEERQNLDVTDENTNHQESSLSTENVKNTEEYSCEGRKSTPDSVSISNFDNTRSEEIFDAQTSLMKNIDAHQAVHNEHYHTHLPINNVTAKPQVRIGQVNVIVEKIHTKATSTSVEKHYDMSSRLFLRGL